MLSRPSAPGILSKDVMGRESMNSRGTRSLCPGPRSQETCLWSQGTGRWGDHAFAAHQVWVTNQAADGRESMAPGAPCSSDPSILSQPPRLDEYAGASWFATVRGEITGAGRKARAGACRRIHIACRRSSDRSGAAFTSTVRAWERGRRTTAPGCPIRSGPRRCPWPDVTSCSRPYAGPRRGRWARAGCKPSGQRRC